MPILSGTTRRKLNNAISPSTLVSVYGIVTMSPYVTVHIGDVISDAVTGIWSIDTGANEGPFIQIQWKKEGDQILPAICNPYITSPPILQQFDTLFWIDPSFEIGSLYTLDVDNHISSVTSIAPGTEVATQPEVTDQPVLDVANQQIVFDKIIDPSSEVLHISNLGNITNNTGNAFTIGIYYPVADTSDNRGYLCSTQTGDQLDIGHAGYSTALKVRSATLKTWTRVASLALTFTVNISAGTYKLFLNADPIEEGTFVPGLTASATVLSIGGRTNNLLGGDNILKRMAFINEEVSADNLAKIHDYILNGDS